MIFQHLCFIEKVSSELFTDTLEEVMQSLPLGALLFSLLQRNATLLCIYFILISPIFSVNHQNSFSIYRKIQLTSYDSDLSKEKRPLSQRGKMEGVVLGQHIQMIAQVMGKKYKVKYCHCLFNWSLWNGSSCCRSVTQRKNLSFSI